ncbi:MAG: GGDEF domain-containing protein [Pirellulaceae bacterium]
MPHLWIIFGSLLGLIPLGIGLAIGYWLGHRHQKRESRTLNSAGGDMRRMVQFTHHFADDVNQHLKLMERLEQKLANGPDSSEGKTVEKAVRVIAEMNHANHKLRRNLEEAEAVLQAQSRQLSQSISEARTDSLTGLLNRRAFDERMEHQWRQWKNKGITFSLILLDIDHFKQVNDTHGHTIGDDVLRQFAATMRDLLWGSDIVARFGGEEMAIIMPETGIEPARMVAQRVLAGVRQQSFVIGSHHLAITASCGLISSTANPADLVDMLRLTDDALYQAKHHGRDRGYWHDGQQVHPLDHDVETANPNSASATKRNSLNPTERPPPRSPDVSPFSPLSTAMQRLQSRFRELSP